MALLTREQGMVDHWRILRGKSGKAWIQRRKGSLELFLCYWVGISESALGHWRSWVIYGCVVCQLRGRELHNGLPLRPELCRGLFMSIQLVTARAHHS